ncbi:hypothetical protein F4818DRAFT_328415 [Hypoxylon cercidicola]|nr:hypothetical protein F4818DRAFT_328415 [Hypoxylon cercidicola]
MRILVLPSSLLLSVVLGGRASTALDNDFSAYPQGSQQCLSDAADQSRCSGSTGQQLNECLCSNQGNFIYNTAQCVARQSPGDLDAVYDTMKNNCAGTGVTIAVSKDAFMSQARAATATSSSAAASSTSSTTTSSSATASATATGEPSNSNDGNGGGMATSVKIGLGVGVGFGAIALGLLAWFVWAYSRRRRSQHAPPSSYPPSSPFPPSAGMSDGAHDRDRGVELSHNYSTAGWASPSLSPGPGHAAAEYAQHNGQFERAELDPNAEAGAGVGVGVQDREWKELPAEYYGSEVSGVSGGATTKHGRDDKRASSVPLLAELGVEDRTPSPSPAPQQRQPVELPGDTRWDGGARASLASSHGEGRRKGRGRGDGDGDGDAG